MAPEVIRNPLEHLAQTHSQGNHLSPEILFLHLLGQTLRTGVWVAPSDLNSLAEAANYQLTENDPNKLLKSLVTPQMREQMASFGIDLGISGGEYLLATGASSDIEIYDDIYRPTETEKILGRVLDEAQQQGLLAPEISSSDNVHTSQDDHAGTTPRRRKSADDIRAYIRTLVESGVNIADITAEQVHAHFPDREYGTVWDVLHRTRGPIFSNSETHPTQPTPSEEPQDRTQRRGTRHAYSERTLQLTPRQQEIITAYVNAPSIEEAAKSLGVTQASLQVQIYQLRNKGHSIPTPHRAKGGHPLKDRTTVKNVEDDPDPAGNAFPTDSDAVTLPNQPQTVFDPPPPFLASPMSNISQFPTTSSATPPVIGNVALAPTQIPKESHIRILPPDPTTTPITEDVLETLFGGSQLEHPQQASKGQYLDRSDELALERIIRPKKLPEPPKSKLPYLPTQTTEHGQSMSIGDDLALRRLLRGEQTISFTLSEE